MAVGKSLDFVVNEEGVMELVKGHKQQLYDTEKLVELQG